MWMGQDSTLWDYLGLSDDMGLSHDMGSPDDMGLSDDMGLFDDMGLSDYMVSECIGLHDVLVVLCFQVRPSHLGTKGAQNFLVMLCNLPSLLIILTYPHLHHHMDRTWNHAIYRDHVLPTTTVILYDRSQRADWWCQATVAMLKEAGAGMVSFKAGDHQVVPPKMDGFLKWGYPKMDSLQWNILLWWILWGYPYFRIPPKLVVSDPKTMISWGFHHQL